MPKPIPKQSKLKSTPEGTLETPSTPVEFPQVEEVPNPTPNIDGTPEESQKIEETPNESPTIEIIPNKTPDKTELPSDVDEKNCVTIDGKKYEIKPTKLKYFRNKAASGYGLIKAVPIHEFLTYGKGVLDADRDADQLMYDFLVAAFDDSIFVRNHYDDLDADIVEQVIKIFGRLNHIDEKEEAARKNREAQAQAKR